MSESSAAGDADPGAHDVDPGVDKAEPGAEAEPDADAARARVLQLLHAAVAAIGGTERPGQLRMAEAVADAVDSGQHLLVQAGTGTGKSLAYLVPALLAAADSDKPVVVATATIALQGQLVDRDLPRLADAVQPLLGRRPTYSMLKGRQNYLCLHRLHVGAPPDDPDALFHPAPTSPLGRDVLRIREWAEETLTGDRDELTPAPRDRAWRQLSVSSRECLGKTRCPYGSECFAELARDDARAADVVVTNHALLAIDAIEGLPLLPEHDVVVVDEAHELVDRVTGVATEELSPAMVERAARRCRKHVSDEIVEDLLAMAEGLGRALAETPPGRLSDLPGGLAGALTAVRDAAHTTITGFSGLRERAADDDESARRQARAGVEAVYGTTRRMVANDRHDVVWVGAERADPARGASLHVAPLSVAGLLRTALFRERTVVLTSATLELGGSFDVVAGSLGLTEDDAPDWRGLDVGSPFDYRRQGILYCAAHLPTPGRDGLSDPMLAELAALIEAAGGRTLGLFSSRRAAEQAAEEMRERLDVPILCQGDDATAELVRRFAADAPTCLFGTLSLWQGVDVPGSACQLVVIDRLPFPRPDDPLMSARQEAAGAAGFMTVAAASAALKLAQGSGRLIRTDTDRGVVAVLDSRLARASYGEFIRRSLPPFWSTTDATVVRRSLAAIAASAPPPVPVRERTVRSAPVRTPAAAAK